MSLVEKEIRDGVEALGEKKALLLPTLDLSAGLQPISLSYFPKMLAEKLIQGLY